MDYAAATPVEPSVLKAMAPYWSEKFYNPSAIYLKAKSVKQDIEKVRQIVARTLGVQSGEVVFTAGGTEANNLAISGVMRRHPKENCVISAIEHESVREAAQQYKHKETPVDKKGVVDLQKLEEIIDSDTVLVSIIYANNEVGTVQPLKAIAEIIEKTRRQRKQKGNKTPLYLHTDACQAANYLDIHANRLGVDLMTLNGGKIYGSKQSGCLYVRAGVVLEPEIRGGGQEFGLRSGTENVANIMGFSKALEMATEKRSAEVERLKKLQAIFIDEIEKNTSNVVVNGHKKHRLPNNVHLTISGADNERLLMELDERGIMCATGSACSASKEESSHVLRSMGFSDEQARASLRFTMGRLTTEKDVTQVVSILRELVAS